MRWDPSFLQQVGPCTNLSTALGEPLYGGLRTLGFIETWLPLTRIRMLVLPAFLVSLASPSFLLLHSHSCCLLWVLQVDRRHHLWLTRPLRLPMWLLSCQMAQPPLFICQGWSAVPSLKSRCLPSRLESLGAISYVAPRPTPCLGQSSVLLLVSSQPAFLSTCLCHPCANRPGLHRAS